VERDILTPRHLKRCDQNLLTNLESLSEMMVLGIPCSLMMWEMKSWAVPSAVTFWVVGMKWAILVKRSTTTRMLS